MSDTDQPDWSDVIQRLTMECGHYWLSGPWESAIGEDGRLRHMIGDITSCEVCPLVPDPVYPDRWVTRIRQVVNVEDIVAAAYREPSSELSIARQQQPRSSS